jgi:hypothetical protein
MKPRGVRASEELAALDLIAAGGEAWVRARRCGGSVDYLRAAVLYGAALAVPRVGEWVDELRLCERQRECWALAVAGPGGEAHVLIANPWLVVLPEPACAAWHGGDWDAFERELRLAELFSPGIVERGVAVMRRYASPDEPATAIAEGVAFSES